MKKILVWGVAPLAVILATGRYYILGKKKEEIAFPKAIQIKDGDLVDANASKAEEIGAVKAGRSIDMNITKADKADANDTKKMQPNKVKADKTEEVKEEPKKVDESEVDRRILDSIVRWYQVNFEYNSYKLNRVGMDDLDLLSEVLKLAKKDILIIGRTDKKGRASYNKKLSRKRAEVVKEYLVSKGVDADILKIVSMGEENITNDKNHKENRRVEFRLKGE